MQSGTPLLELQDISVAAGGNILLHNLNLTLQSGEIIAITGPSGCGKTTLLRCIAGLADPCSGQILFEGIQPDGENLPAFRRKVVLIDQRPVLLDGTVSYNLQRPFTYKTADGPFDEARAKELLEALGVGTGRFSQNARSLSVGQQQRVCFIRALLIKPKVLLLDEPTSALDETARDLVENIIKGEAQRGAGVIVVLHDLTLAERLSLRRLDLTPYFSHDVSPCGNSGEAK